MNSTINQPLCSVIIISYNNDSDLSDCLDAVYTQIYRNFEIILVDNASTDRTAEIVAAYQEIYIAADEPQLTLVSLDENRGFAGGNNAGAAASAGSILVFLNPDTIAKPDWLGELIKPLNSALGPKLAGVPSNIKNPKATTGLTTSCILLADSPQLINTCGNSITWTGLTFCRGLNKPQTEWGKGGTVAAVSGAAFAIPQSLYAELGGFDESFFMYFEDTDLSMRAHLAGYTIEYVPTSQVYHRYIFKFSPQKIFYQERNRWFTMFKVLRMPTLVLLMPGFLIGELIAWCYAAINGKEHLIAKVNGWQWLWRNRAQVQQLRKKTQLARKSTDRLLLRTWSARINLSGTVPDSIVAPLEAAVALPLTLYGRICQQIIVW